ncbi:hypothetical protein PDE_04599 [Penicillium oxalicum 114-2]|uniref:Uncharacterized protein n=1 Tax=Penicillium oxalicum (strain 114-2 / CGMCC 5302) TaxID=933388 RepID=S7ZH89_PENO1|nr:hypothetical protein PDE_04599 [Penicillium oxalicum 114-2]
MAPRDGEKAATSRGVPDGQRSKMDTAVPVLSNSGDFRVVTFNRLLSLRVGVWSKK